MNFYKVRVINHVGNKEIIFFTADNEVKHVFTTSLTSEELGDKHVIDYHESEDRVVSRLKSRDDTQIEELCLDEVLIEALKATRTSLGIAIFKKIKTYYEEGRI